MKLGALAVGAVLVGAALIGAWANTHEPELLVHAEVWDLWTPRVGSDR